MPTRSLFIALLVGAAAPARAQEFSEAPTLSFGAAYASSFHDKYVSHSGVLVRAEYGPWHTLGLSLVVGGLRGTYEELITGENGVVDNRMASCLGSSLGGDCSNLDPELTDMLQVTGVAQLGLSWTPLELRLREAVVEPSRLFVMLGGGVNGTRRPRARALPEATSQSDWQLEGGDFGEGGWVNDRVFHVALAAGARIVPLEHLFISAELRSLRFTDDYAGEWSKDDGVTWVHLVAIGVGAGGF